MLRLRDWAPIRPLPAKGSKDHRGQGRFPHNALPQVLVLDYIAAMLISLLPSRYRKGYRPGVDLDQGTALSGLLEYASCLVVLFVRYVDFMQRRLLGFGAAAVARGRDEVLAAPSVQYGMGFVAMLEFVFHPLSLLLVYLTLEGLVRFLAGAVTRETLGTMPLYLIGWAHERLKREAEGGKKPKRHRIEREG